MVQTDIFNAIEHGLRQAESVQTPAEAHGTLTGLLCIDNDIPGARAVEDAQSETLDTALDALKEMTLNGLLDPGLSFAPLLPNDEIDLERRVTALARWSAGFLYGLSATGQFDPNSLSEQSREIVGDLTELSRTELTSEDDDAESAEADYAELVEYVRVAAQTLFIECRPKRDGPQTRRTLH